MTQVLSDMTETMELTKAAFAKMKDSQDALAQAWKAFAREVVAAHPMPPDWTPTLSPLSRACLAACRGG